MVWLKNREKNRKQTPKQVLVCVCVYKTHLVNNKDSVSKQEGHNKWLKGAAANE